MHAIITLFSSPVLATLASLLLTTIACGALIYLRMGRCREV